MRRILVLWTSLLCFGSAAAQRSGTDSIQVQEPVRTISDKEIKKKLGLGHADSFLSPKKIALFSSILPGLGQYYNRHYWKIPVIYAGVGAAIYFANDNLKNYNLYRKLSVAHEMGDQELIATSPYSREMVNLQRDYYRRNLDLTVLITALGYGLQVIDAVVFAHLNNFDISDDLSLRAQPVLMPQGGIGMGLVLKF
jgi:hypothetical protein